MGMSRFAGLATGAAFAFMIAGTASAATTVASEGQCVTEEGTVMDLQGVKHCLVPIIPEEFQGAEYAGELKGVTECQGTVRKTNIGDFCLIALEAKPAASASTAPASNAVNNAIGEQAQGAAALVED